jgi:hypothetical protein
LLGYVQKKYQRLIEKNSNLDRSSQWRREEVKAGGVYFEKREKILKNSLKRRESNSDNLG